jgi:putative intracellular protease/amidase
MRPLPGFWRILKLHIFFTNAKFLSFFLPSVSSLILIVSKVCHRFKQIVGKRVTGFTNSEEEAVRLTEVVPFLVEDELKRLGGRFEKVADWQSFAIADGHLITDQNPASSTAAAQELIKLLASVPEGKS